MRSAPLHPARRPGSLARHDDPFLPGRHPLRHLQAQRRGDARPGRRPQGPHRQGAPGRRRGVAQAPRRARQAPAARARAGAARSRLAVPRAVAAGRDGHVRQRGAGLGRHHRRRPGERRRMRDRLQRRHGEGRHLLSDDGEEASPRPGSGDGEPSALHLPGRFRRRQPAAMARGLPRQDPFRPHLLQPGQHVGAGHPADRRGHGLVHGGRRLCAGDERRDRHRAQAGHDLPGRPAAG